MKIMVTGSTGLVGSALVSALEKAGHEVMRLTRSPSAATGTIVLWDPDASEIIERNRLEGLDAVVHLAGENIAGHRWTPQQKAAIRNSRVQGTGLLARTLASLSRPPGTLLSASATGYYGHRGNEELTEESSLGEGFLAGVCRDWEAATQAAAAAGIRTVRMRIGFVLSARGGGLPKMLRPFKAGLGGRIGSGRQWMSWINIEDVVGAILHLLTHEEVSGPVNLVSPGPVMNRDFTRALGKVLDRPTLLPIPAFAMHLLMGDMADELLLTSAKVVPAVLQRSGYSFQYRALEPALRHELGSV